MYLFAVAYSANIGGTGVITGSGTNLAFQEVMHGVDISQGGKYLDMNFSTWLALNVPGMLLNVLIAYAYLTTVYFGLPDFLRFKKRSTEDTELERENSANVSKLLMEQYKALGGVTFQLPTRGT